MSNQISTAGYEASGTSNMKFMMNGALTIGTRDGATIEMAEAAGEENFFLFGLTAEQVAGSRSWYSPHWHYDNEPETRAVLDLIFSDRFSRSEPGIFEPLRHTLLTSGDHYMHLADLASYLDADRRLLELYADPDGWARRVDPERARAPEVLERPNHSRICRGDLGRQAMRGSLSAAHEAEPTRGADPSGRVTARIKFARGATVSPRRSELQPVLASTPRASSFCSSTMPTTRSRPRTIRLDPVPTERTTTGTSSCLD